MNSYKKKKSPLNLDKTLLILDIDETLIHSTQNSLGRPYDFKVSRWFVYRRPGLEEFISYILDNFHVAVWSSAGVDYVKAIVNNIFSDPDKDLKFYWDTRRCTIRVDFQYQRYYDIKDLNKVRRTGYKKERILIVDDTPDKSERNYGNAIFIPPFEGNLDDRYLYMLIEYLDTLKDINNVRAIDKRVWWRDYE
ncbi:MAG: HAD family hydrolase [Promethearchaeota archaeon]